jgi:hypothetical protein
MDFMAVKSDKAGFTSLVGGLLGIEKQGAGRFIYLQIDPDADADWTAVEELDPQRHDAKAKVITKESRMKNRARSYWNMVRFNSLVLMNLGVDASRNLATRLMQKQNPAAPCMSVNDWVYLGPFTLPENPVMVDGFPDPLAVDFSEYHKSRNIQQTYLNSRKEKATWYFPTDCANGLGIDGFMDLSQCYGARLGCTAFAVTQVYSTCERTATIKFGADWWAIIYINGQEIFRTVKKDGRSTFASGFAQTIRCRLKAGWNDIMVQVAAGDNSHSFHFKLSNPGDLVIVPGIAAPSFTPKKKVEILLSDDVVPLYSLYAGGLDETDDPYRYIRW